MPSLKNQKGFTIIELMIATATFSLLLIVILSALVYIGRLYYKGTTEAKTQEVSRTVVERVSQSVQFSGVPVRFIPGGSGWAGAYCVGSKKFSFKTNTQLVGGTPGTRQSNEVFIESDDVNCQTSTSPAPANNPAELLDELMRVNEFRIRPSNGLVDITMSVAFGGDPSVSNVDNGMFSFDNNGVITACQTGAPGTEFCAVGRISTTVFRKVN